MAAARIQSAYVLLLLLAAPAGAEDCLAVEGPTVQASALLPFIDPVSDLPMDRVLTSTPAPGTRRWIRAAELRRWGLSPQTSLGEPGICVERRLKPLQSESVRSEVQAALHSRLGNVQLLGITSVQPSLSPEGHLNLPPAGLQLLSADEEVCSFLWRGAIQYDEHRVTPIKVLGRYQTEVIHFVAKRDLRAGDVLGPNDYEKVAKPGCAHGRATSLVPQEGSMMRRALGRGDVIEATMLKAPPVVEEGSVVRVMASAGGALVSIEAIAEGPGRRGESVFVVNKGSGKRVRVLLTGRGEASAIVPGATR
jgi:flagella basal body P-ring formation protein FlgA